MKVSLLQISAVQPGHADARPSAPLPAALIRLAGLPGGSRGRGGGASDRGGRGRGCGRERGGRSGGGSDGGRGRETDVG